VQGTGSLLVPRRQLDGLPAQDSLLVPHRLRPFGGLRPLGGILALGGVLVPGNLLALGGLLALRGLLVPGNLLALGGLLALSGLLLLPGYVDLLCSKDRLVYEV
jgi:hypothetical protein